MDKIKSRESQDEAAAKKLAGGEWQKLGGQREKFTGRERSSGCVAAGRTFQRQLSHVPSTEHYLNVR